MTTAPTTAPTPATPTSGKGHRRARPRDLGHRLLPVILSIAAIIYGKKARNEIDSNPSLSGRGLAVAGIVLGWVGIGLAVVCFAIGVALGIYS